MAELEGREAEDCRYVTLWGGEEEEGNGGGRASRVGPTPSAATPPAAPPHEAPPRATPPPAGTPRHAAPLAEPDAALPAGRAEKARRDGGGEERSVRVGPGYQAEVTEGGSSATDGAVRLSDEDLWRDTRPREPREGGWKGAGGVEYEYREWMEPGWQMPRTVEECNRQWERHRRAGWWREGSERGRRGQGRLAPAAAPPAEPPPAALPADTPPAAALALPHLHRRRCYIAA